MLRKAVGWSFSGGFAMRYVLPVYWVTPYFPMKGPILRATQVGCKLKVTRQRVAQIWHQYDLPGGSIGPAWSLMSTIALFFSHHIVCQCTVQKLELLSGCFLKTFIDITPMLVPLLFYVFTFLFFNLRHLLFTVILSHICQPLLKSYLIFDLIWWMRYEWSHKNF